MEQSQFFGGPVPFEYSTLMRSASLSVRHPETVRMPGGLAAESAVLSAIWKGGQELYQEAQGTRKSARRCAIYTM